MESIFSGIGEILSSFKNIDWAAFLLWWLGIEKALKVLAKITPWQWDDDLVEVVNKAIHSVIKPKPSE